MFYIGMWMALLFTVQAAVIAARGGYANMVFITSNKNSCFLCL